MTVGSGLFVRLLLAAILAGAAAGKARPRGRDAARAMLAAAGLRSARLRSALTWAAVTAELVLAGWLLSGRALALAATLVAALGLAFAAVAACARVRGHRRVACGCFGGTTARPWWLAALRALGLAALALVLIVPAPTAPGELVLLWIAVGVLLVLVLLLAVVVAAMVRQVGVLTLRLGPRAPLELAAEGPSLGEPAPPLDGLARDASELVVFGSPACRLCLELEPGLRALARDGLPVRRVDELAEPEQFSRWNVPGTPFVVHVRDGVAVAKGLVNTLEQVEMLLDAGMLRSAEMSRA